MITWILVLLTMRADGSVIEQRFGPFRQVENCQTAGERWLESRVGAPELLQARWECRAEARR